MQSFILLKRTGIEVYELTKSLVGSAVDVTILAWLVLPTLATAVLPFTTLLLLLLLMLLVLLLQLLLL